MGMEASPEGPGPGFFLLRPDGTVLLAGELAALAAGTGSAPAPARAFRDYLGLNPEQAALFDKWMELVRKRNRDLRWDKLAALAPVQEIRAGRDGDAARIRLSYRKLEDAQGGLAGISVLAGDASTGQAMARQLEEERQRHQLELRDVLALAANPPETVGAFLEDARGRLDAARGEWDAWLASRPGARGEVRGLWEARDGESPGQRLFRELHMVKGNAGAFGFENLAAVAQESEDLLESLKREAGEPALGRFTQALAALGAQAGELRRAMKLIAGEGQEAMARILKWKLDRLVAAAGALPAGSLEPPLRSLVESTRRLAFLSPAYLARKYRNLVERIARNLGKQVAFRVASNTGDIHPESFARVDEALVHILRNMVDHGIELPSERAAAGKGEAEIELEYVAEEDRIFLRIRDNGRGMDPAVIAARGVDLGLLTPAEAESLDDVGKLGIIFREGFTTRREAGLISGRGLGLALAARCVADRGGNLYVYSRPGEGTRFAIELPHVGQKSLDG